MADEQNQNVLEEQDTEQLEVNDEETTTDNTEPDQSTDTASDSDDLDTNDADNSGDYEPSDEEISNLSDEEFEEFMVSGKYPESKRGKKQETKTEEKEEPVEEPVEDQKEEQEETKPEPKQEQNGTVDYEAFYKQLMQPFKANGKEVTPRSPNDIISLMQMGANYTQKMQMLAPIRKQAQSLANANISNDDLSLLIDVYKGNKDAIKEILKKNNIDPTDIDIDEETNYQTNLSNLATDSDVEFQDALLESKNNHQEIVRILDNQWDSKSKQLILNNPELLKGLNYEIETGRFQQIQPIVESEKALGRYNGYSDVEAYVDVLNQLQQQYLQRNSQQQSMPVNAETVKKPRQTSRVIPDAGDKSKAAPSRGKSSPSKTTLTKEQLFSMSDEEFEKLTLRDLV